MASIITTLYPKMFTGEFVQLKFSCPGDSMSFSITDASGEIFAQTYYPDENDGVTIYDLDRFFEDHIEGFSNTYSFYLDDTKIGEVMVIFSRVAVAEAANTFYKDFFFTPSMYERDTALGRHELVTAYTDEETDVNAICTYRSADGSIVSKTVELDAVTGLSPIDVSPLRFYDAESGTLLSYIVQAGTRKARYRVLSAPPEVEPAIIFRNCFGCWETIHFTGSKQVSPTHTRSSALIEGQMRVYTIDEVMSFKAHTGPLRPGMVPVALDLARAIDIYLLNSDGTTGSRLTITASDIKYTNEDQAIPDFEFTYRLTDRRNAVLSVVRPPKVFDDTFDETYE